MLCLAPAPAYIVLEPPREKALDQGLLKALCPSSLLSLLFSVLGLQVQARGCLLPMPLHTTPFWTSVPGSS